MKSAEKLKQRCPGKTKHIHILNRSEADECVKILSIKTCYGSSYQLFMDTDSDAEHSKEYWYSAFKSTINLQSLSSVSQRIYDSTPAYEEKIIKVTLFLQILRFQKFGNQLPVVVMLLLLHRICILDLHEISIQNELSEWFVRRTFCCENVMNISWFKFKATINLKYQVLLWCIKTIHHNC